MQHNQKGIDMLSQRCRFIPDPKPTSGIRRALRLNDEFVTIPDLEGALPDALAQHLLSKGVTTVFMSSDLHMAESDDAVPDEFAEMSDLGMDIGEVDAMFHPSLESKVLHCWGEDGHMLEPTLEMGIALSTAFLHLVADWPDQRDWLPPKAETICVTWNLSSRRASIRSYSHPTSVIRKRTRRFDASSLPGLLGAPVAANCEAAMAAAAEQGLTHMVVQVDQDDGLQDDEDEVGLDVPSISYWTHGKEHDDDSLLLEYEPPHPEPEHIVEFPSSPFGKSEEEDNYIDEILGLVASKAIRKSPKDEFRAPVTHQDTTTAWRWLVQVRTPLHAQYAKHPVVVKAQLVRTNHKILHHHEVQTPGPEDVFSGLDFMPGKAGSA